MRTVFTGTTEQTALVQQGSLSAEEKEKLEQKIKEIDSKKSVAYDLMATIFYGGVIGSTTWYASSQVSYGLAVFAMYMAWNTAIMAKPEFWGRMLARGENGGLTIGQRAAALVGRELTKAEERLYRVAGRLVSLGS